MKSPPNADSWLGAALVMAGPTKIRVVAATELGKPGYNEESVGFDEDRRLAVVVRGGGGFPEGITAQVVRDAAFGHDDPAAALIAADEVLGRRNQRQIFGHSIHGEAARAIAAVLHADGALIAHVGDCRAGLWSDGELRWLTRDHRLSPDECVEKGYVRPDTAELFRSGFLFRALTGRQEEVPELTRVAYHLGDRLIMTTYGVHEAIDDLAPLVAIADLEQAVTAILAAACQRGHDNATVLLAEIG
jgi:hypothetical protein